MTARARRRLLIAALLFCIGAWGVFIYGLTLAL